MVEDEQITSVYLDLPFYNNTNDSDNDGVIDIYDVDPNNSLSDSDTVACLIWKNLDLELIH